MLVIGSGHLTHNLRELRELRGLRDTSVGRPEPYVSEFQAWVRECIDTHNVERLADYRRLSSAGARAHPTEEHFLPLFVALGAARDGYRALHRARRGRRPGDGRLPVPSRAVGRAAARFSPWTR